MVNTALAKEPKQRFVTVRAFAKALEQASAGQAPTIVKSPSSQGSAPVPSLLPPTQATAPTPPRLAPTQFANMGSVPLAEMQVKKERQSPKRTQELAHPLPIAWDARVSALEPREVTFSEGIVARIRHMLLQASTYNDRTPPADIAWVEDLIEQAKDVLVDDFQPCFVLDYLGVFSKNTCSMVG